MSGRISTLERAAALRHGTNLSLSSSLLVCYTRGLLLSALLKPLSSVLKSRFRKLKDKSFVTAQKNLTDSVSSRVKTRLQSSKHKVPPRVNTESKNIPITRGAITQSHSHSAVYLPHGVCLSLIHTQRLQVGIVKVGGTGNFGRRWS